MGGEAEHEDYERGEMWREEHQRWKAHQGRHPQYEGDEYSGEETMREGDGLKMMVKR